MAHKILTVTPSKLTTHKKFPFQIPVKKVILVNTPNPFPGYTPINSQGNIENTVKANVRIQCKKGEVKSS